MNGKDLIESNMASLHCVAAELAVVCVIMLLLLIGLTISIRHRRSISLWTGFFGLVVTWVLVWWVGVSGQEGVYFCGLMIQDRFSLFFKKLFLIAGAFALLMAHMNREIETRSFNEYSVLILSVTLAMMLLASSVDLLMIYLAFEMMGLISYGLAGIKVTDPKSSEAGLKFVLYGAFTSGIMLFGFSFLYGLSGTTNILTIAKLASASSDPQARLLLVLVVLFVTAGLFFKTATFPFHFWCPDVYQGAPTPVTAFLSVGPKAAGFALLIRLFYTLFAHPAGGGVFLPMEAVDWPRMAAVVSAVTMTVGNLGAMHQNDLKRLLAYSSIAHAGYILMGFCTATVFGIRVMLFYLTVYLFMNLGAFAVVTGVAASRGGTEMRLYKGLGARDPFVAVSMAIFLFSLVGLPPFSGFVGKIYLFAAVIVQKYYWLAIVAAANTVLSLYYYARVIKAMFMEAPEGKLPEHISRYSQLIVASLLVPTVLLGIYWQPLASHLEKLFS